MSYIVPDDSIKSTSTYNTVTYLDASINRLTTPTHWIPTVNGTTIQRYIQQINVATATIFTIIYYGDYNVPDNTLINNSY